MCLQKLAESGIDEDAGDVSKAIDEAFSFTDTLDETIQGDEVFTSSKEGSPDTESTAKEAEEVTVDYNETTLDASALEEGAQEGNQETQQSNAFPDREAESTLQQASYTQVVDVTDDKGDRGHVLKKELDVIAESTEHGSSSRVENTAKQQVFNNIVDY